MFSDSYNLFAVWDSGGTGLPERVCHVIDFQLYYQMQVWFLNIFRAFTVPSLYLIIAESLFIRHTYHILTNHPYADGALCTFHSLAIRIDAKVNNRPTKFYFS